MKRMLAVAATCAAAVASIATSQSEPIWEISATADGPALTLATNGSVTHTATVAVNEAAYAGDEYPYLEARLTAFATACVEGAPAGPVTLLLTLLDTSGDGRIHALDIPGCPERADLEAHAWEPMADCVDAGDCATSFRVVLQREGAEGGTVEVAWSVAAFVSGRGTHEPPEGAEITLVIE